MPTYLVTGVAGFIGSHIAERLLADGQRVVGIDDLSTGRRSNLERLPKLEFHEGSLLDGALVDRLCSEVEIIFHQAAIPSVPRSLQEPIRTHQANTTGSLQLVVSASVSDRTRRIVFASSSSVYGDTPELPKHEAMPANPKSPYAAAKLMCEHLMRVYCELGDIETVGLRYFNVFGPWQDPKSKYAAVIPIFAEHATLSQAAPINGDGKQTRDFTYIENVVAANLLAAEAKAEAVAGRVFNIACAERIDLLQLWGMIQDAFGVSLGTDHRPARVGDVRDSLASLAAAEASLGYQPSVDVRTGVQRYVEWYRQGLDR